MGFNLTQQDIKWIKEKYPKITIHADKLVIYGIVNFHLKYNGTVLKDEYSVKVKLSCKANSIIPKVSETDGKIKLIAKELSKPLIDMHVDENEDKTLCLCIPQKEKDYFPNGFNFKIFFEQLLEPYLYWVSYYRKFKYPPWEEYAHGMFGYLELYAEGHINFSELKKLITEEKLEEISNLKGHDLCLCDKKKLRNCHKYIYQAIYKLKKELSK